MVSAAKESSQPISFGRLPNPCTEYITFEVVDMHYPYNAIFDRGLVNTFEVALHSASHLRSDSNS
jgi:hypothetical protein